MWMRPTCSARRGAGAAMKAAAHAAARKPRTRSKLIFAFASGPGPLGEPRRPESNMAGFGVVHKLALGLDWIEVVEPLPMNFPSNKEPPLPNPLLHKCVEEREWPRSHDRDAPLVRRPMRIKLTRQ